MLLLTLALAAEPAPPRLLTERLFKVEDYPRAAEQRREEGKVGFTLDVNAEGLPTACRITLSSGSSALDEATCRLAMRRAKFEPARDRSGQPTGGSWQSTTWWGRSTQLPGTSQVSFQANGGRTNCIVIYNGARRLLRDDICGRMVASIPNKSRRGRSVRMTPTEEMLQPLQP